jgi:GntR family transcriptional repressor for pyruvate dehydrogenase complex
MMDLRILVETFCARRLATGNSSLAAVRQQLQQMKKNATHLARFADADMAFHLAVVKASGHTLFFEVLNAVLPEIGRNFARQTHSDTTVAQKTLREHQQIFHALERRNPAQAEQRMRKHLEQSRVHLLLRFQEAIAVRPQFKVAGKAQKPRSAPRAYRRSA